MAICLKHPIGNVGALSAYLFFLFNVTGVIL